MIDALYAFLKSVGFDEPLHPPITHMPIGLATGALIFFLVALVFRRKVLEPTARHSAILAFIFVFPTILLGVLDWLHYYRGVMMPSIQVKIALAAMVLVALGAVIILGGEAKLRSHWTASLLAVAFVGVMGLGYVGGGIVYGRGVTIVKPAQPGASTAAPEAASPEFIRGLAVFSSNCQACHGNGENLIVPSLPLKSSAKLGSLDSFVAFVRKPSMPDGSSGDMPPFGPETLDDAALADLYAYVTRAWK